MNIEKKHWYENIRVFNHIHCCPKSKGRRQHWEITSIRKQCLNKSRRTNTAWPIVRILVRSKKKTVQEEGASNWLPALPVKRKGFSLCNNNKKKSRMLLAEGMAGQWMDSGYVYLWLTLQPKSYYTMHNRRLRLHETWWSERRDGTA